MSYLQILRYIGLAYLQNFRNEKSSEVRNFEATALVGEKRTGKSTFVKIYVDKYLKLYPTAKILVFDISDAFGPSFDQEGNKVFAGYPLIKESELLNGGIISTSKGKTKWMKGVKRIVDIDPDVFLKYVAEEFRNGLVVIDEAATVFPPTPSPQQKKFLITHTNHKCDGLYIFHRLADIPKSLRNNFWNFIFFSTGDNINRDDSKIGTKDIADMGFQYPTQFYAKWIEAQVPENPEHIIQKFTLHKKKTNIKQ